MNKSVAALREQLFGALSDCMTKDLFGLKKRLHGINKLDPEKQPAAVEKIQLDIEKSKA